MLVLSRKSAESIIVNGNICIKVLHVDRDVVKLGIDAPAAIPVYRQEVYDEIQRSNQAAVIEGKPVLPRLSSKPPRCP